jgi:hypothetical protein
MREAIVIGGYGRIGAACCREIAETGSLSIAVAGPGIQRADELAHALGERARGVYADASDPRTLRAALPGAAVVVDCAGLESGATLEVAIDLRVPYVSLAPHALEAREANALEERAWKAQVPIVLDAGAVPGLPGVLCEWIVRRLPEVDTLRVASTGPWAGSACAQRDVQRLRGRGDAPREFTDREWVRARARTVRWQFPEPIGSRALRPVRPVDLLGFPDAHCVRNLTYLEPDPGWLARGLERIVGIEPSWEFAVAAEARSGPDAERADLEIAVTASDVLTAAAAVAGRVAALAAEGGVPAGLWSPRTAVNPAALLDAIEKRGLRVAVQSA